jgi:hypothetical protein
MRKTAGFLLSLALLAPASFAQSDADASFEKLKALAGTWEGVVKTTPVQADVEGQPARITLRVTSSGHALIHEATSPARHDDPLTVFYIDDGRLLLTHYCDAGNRPRMTASALDGNTLDFTFVDIAGSTKYGHMHHSTFTFVDADHHIEDWTYMKPGDKPMHARFELTRVK